MTSSLKPERLAREVVYESEWVNLYKDTVKFPNGFIVDKFHLLDFEREAVAALMENEAGEAMFVRVPRYTTGAADWELPAGGVEVGESLLAAAEREAREETGYASSEHRLVYTFHPMNGSANKVFHIVFCKAGERAQDFDPNEIAEIRWFAKDEIRAMIQEGAIKDGFSLIALLLWLQG
ncbi:MAG: NUDIX hydrolase [Anaerolineales bacterium]|nr:NUDIX hydrolase [Anaerolineales bacterium]